MSAGWIRCAGRSFSAGALRLALCVGSLLLCAPVEAQFVVRVQQGTDVVQLPSGGVAQITSPAVGTTRTIQVLITYVGSTKVTFSGQIQKLGSDSLRAEFEAGGGAVISLAPAESTRMRVTYAPTDAERASAQFDLPYSEDSPVTPVAPGSPPAPVVPPRPGLLNIGIAGGVPVFSFSYLQDRDGNSVVVNPGESLLFPQTAVNEVAIATANVLNRGSGTGRIQSVQITGAAFSLANLPVLPSNLEAGGRLAFQIIYRPRQVGDDEGSLTVTLDGNVVNRYLLKGQGVTSFLTYEQIVPGGEAIPLRTGQAIQYSPTSVGSFSRIQIRFRNITNIDLVLNGIGLSGPPFSLEDLPFFPLTLPPNGSETFTVEFRPTTSGQQVGRLRVGNDSFDLRGEGLGPALRYYYVSSTDSAPVEVRPLELVTLPSAQVGRSSKIDIIVENKGTAAAVVNSIGVSSQGRNVFTVEGLPPSPYLLARDERIRFSVRFQPNVLGFAGGNLLVDSTSFVVSGFGQTPVPLPDYTVRGPSQANPLDQPRISLSLSEPYGVALTGTLTISPTSEFGSDPALIFSNGSRSVGFTIPANSVNAVFPGGSQEIVMQVGSVAGTFTITPSFATEGELSLTPPRVSPLRTTIAAAAPQVLSLQLAERSATTMVFRVSGITTNRNLSKVDVKFEGRAGFNIPSSTFTFDLAGQSAVWFSSASSIPFGGQFTLDLPFLFSSTDQTISAPRPTDALESVQITLSNTIGSAQAVSLALR